MTDIGFHPQMSRAAYESIRAANFSTLKGFRRSPAHVFENMLHPRAPTTALTLGTNIHAAILEPRRFEDDFVVAPQCDRRTKDGKARWASFEVENAHKEIVSADEYNVVNGVRDSVWNHPTAASMLSGLGHVECAAVWKHERTGEVCKALVDRISEHCGWSYVIDVKSTKDASPRAFSASVARYDYAAQAAHYLAGMNSIAPRARRFAWIAVEIEPPFACAVYEPDSAALLAGESVIERWMDMWAECRRSNIWPAYPGEIQTLSLPRWALTEETFSE